MTLQVGKKYRLPRSIDDTNQNFTQGIDATTNEYVSVKFEPLKKKPAILPFEYSVFEALQGNPGIPNVRWYGVEHNHRALVIDGVGPSLEDLLKFCGGKFSLKTVLLIADQLLSRLECLHEHGFVHRDVEPGHFLIGMGHHENIFHAIGFQQAKKYLDPETKEHIPYRGSKKLIGHGRFASLNAHFGSEQTRRDDLESLGLMFIYFLDGSLPWQGLPSSNKDHKYDQIAEMKAHISLDRLCSNVPPAFKEYLEYCRGLQFDAKPDYAMLRSLFRRVSDLFRFERDDRFDWVVKAEQK
eukprot:TRINITY_DN13304_c0_g1::TRINITY_DN13304_c0_g1_i1::g.12628::m.12628 TRINITY_DN13304_c0_g1::TRINITY_DN13304_c0_g1_i1::g.12628  ORF type:complete len:297 (+),score=-0.39,sp/Q9ZUP4/CKL5_ARATH/48.82/9e-96,Pkinase/PF00069.20/4.6e-15,Pkinase_Tyr/PF07714.12/0.073 TRINITY_DN13304_c0_g1_i1:100-990(+)